MISGWHTYFGGSSVRCLSLIAALCGFVAYGAMVTGQVELTNSLESAVHKHKDYSGVVIWLEPADHASPGVAPRRVEVLQKDRHFQPHVTAIPLGSTVDFPNLDPIYHNAFSNFAG